MKIAHVIRRLILRAKALWSELDYAQRRLFEVRTGIELDDLQRRRRARRTLAELEAHYHADGLWLADELWLADDLPAAG